MNRVLDKAILKGKEVVPVDDFKEWGLWFEAGRNTGKNPRRVAETFIGDARVSTVFLGLNHRYGDGPPLWFETMIFGGVHDGFQDRYETWDQAEAGHAKAVELLRRNP